MATTRRIALRPPSRRLTSGIARGGSAPGVGRIGAGGG
jgi:hypothetical protein